MSLRLVTRKLGSKVLPILASTSKLHSRATSFGDVAFRILETINKVEQRGQRDIVEGTLEEETELYVCDINPNKLYVGKQRALERVIPVMGELVAGDRGSYQYLVESIRRSPSQDKFASMIVDAGFQNVEYESLVGGVVSIHSGLKI